ncbi:MAG TPA: NADH-quinone oxidoreductase subunit C [Casimicrobiaceae bacterium]|jgi:Ni,Fe-hydrogenase III large subunit/Ni,Fe-hydrogenase III component G
MNVSPLGLAASPLPCGMPAQRCRVNSGQLLSACRLAWERGGQLVALWASDERDRARGFTVRVLLRDGDGLTLLEHTLPDEQARYPDLSPIFPAANRMQRAAFDLSGAQSDADDQRPWAWQAAWPIDRFPLQRDFEASPKWEPGQEDYSFVRVAGEGVHEIAVGPVHAGTIEPGHFRFQVVGEKVLRLEERLGYVHKGIEKRFESMSLLDGYRLAGRISGDSTVGYACAYAQAVESIVATAAPPRASWLRALCLERERIASHLGDLGYLGNDGGFAFGHSQFSRLREDVLRLNDRAFGHRLLMDVVRPGGVARDLRAEDVVTMREQCVSLERELAVLRDIYDEHATLQDRFRNCGQVTRELASKLGLTGLAGRASGIPDDLRCDFAWTPYDALGVRRATHGDGDVAARVAVRFDETLESLRLVAAMLGAMPDGDIAVTLPEAPASRLSIGCAEGWRGPIFIALESGPGGAIRRCHPHDPSWQNWPVIEHAVIGNIVPDFPLINKSFNLSYSGHDL